MFNFSTRQPIPPGKLLERFRPACLVLVTLLLVLASLLLNACTSAPGFTPTPTSKPNSSETPRAISTTGLQPANTPKITTNSNLNSATTTIPPAFRTATALTPVNTSPLALPDQNPPTTNSASVASNQLVSGAGCGQAALIKPGTTETETIGAKPVGARGSATRSYRLHLPSKYSVGEPHAVLLVFHGHGGNAVEMEATTGFSVLADQEGFIAVYPQGLKDDDGLPMWASVGPAADYGIDELTFVNDLLNKLQKELCVNSQRIYATGFSNGGGMSHYLACRLAGRIAAVVPIAGNYFALPDGGCQPSRAVALLEIHGTADDVIPYAGRADKEYPGWPLPSIPDYLAEWAKRNGCSKGPQTFLDTKEAKGEEWTECRDNATVAHYQIKGGGHSYPDTLGGSPGKEVIWSFLYKHTLG